MRDCCKKPENLEHKDNGNGTWVDQCKVCGARHYGMNAEAMKPKRA